MAGRSQRQDDITTETRWGHSFILFIKERTFLLAPSVGLSHLSVMFQLYSPLMQKNKLSILHGNLHTVLLTHFSPFFSGLCFNFIHALLLCAHFKLILHTVQLQVVSLYVFAVKVAREWGGLMKFIFLCQAYASFFAVLSLQIHPLSLWFQTSSSWPDSLTTWLSLRTDPPYPYPNPIPAPPPPSFHLLS